MKMYMDHFCRILMQYAWILERLAEVTRLGQVVPSLVAQVLLCFRVLLLRMSPRGVTSLWPVIITELVQVFLMMEQELATDTEQFRYDLVWKFSVNDVGNQQAFK